MKIPPELCSNLLFRPLKQIFAKDIFPCMSVKEELTHTQMNSPIQVDNITFTKFVLLPGFLRYPSTHRNPHNFELKFLRWSILKKRCSTCTTKPPFGKFLELCANQRRQNFISQIAPMGFHTASPTIFDSCAIFFVSYNTHKNCDETKIYRIWNKVVNLIYFWEISISWVNFIIMFFFVI